MFFRLAKPVFFRLWDESTLVGMVGQWVCGVKLAFKDRDTEPKHKSSE